MEWDEYKRLCERPDHFSRWALELTAESVTDARVRDRLAAAFETRPLEKPRSHRGGPETDYFRIDVALHHAEAITRLVNATASTSEGKQQRRLNHLAVVWREYTDFLRGL